MERPTQAVILAGGRGTRLRPLTDHRPKPMIEFHGKPFLEFLVELLRREGIRRVLLLLGYLPEIIQDHFGDGRRWGVQIDYAVSPVEDETGRRLRRAQTRIEQTFLLLYCDNYWPLSLDRMWKRYLDRKVLAQITVYANRDRHTRDNVRVDEGGYVTLYDRGRTAAGLGGVDIGFGIFGDEVLELLPEDNVSFEATVYPELARRRQLTAYVTEHRYYSVSTPERLGATEEFLAARPAVILDRDGVLNTKPPRAEYVRSWADWEWRPGARDALRLFREAGYRVLVLSNQAGIARGVMTEADLQAIHERMTLEGRAAGGEIHAIYHCPHGWDEGCECRKPKPGMFFRAQRDFALDLSRTYFIGDDERDAQAAEAAGCRYAAVSEEVSLLEVARRLLRKSGRCERVGHV